MVCDRVKASFNAPYTTITPLAYYKVGLLLEFGLCRTITIDNTAQYICVGDGGALLQVD
jgi:hypothetical protein